MNLTPLIEYQESDLALRLIRREIASHPEQLRLKKTKAEYKVTQKTLTDNEEAAAKIVAFYQKTLEGYQEYLGKIDSLLEKLNSIPEEDEENRKAAAVEVEAMRNRLASIEKRLNESKIESEKILKSSTEARMQQKKLWDAAKKLTEAVEETEKKYAEKIAELESKMKAARSAADPKLMERYDKLSVDKFPPVNEVKIIDKSSYYCYCGIELSGSSKEELVAKKLCVCGNCGRIVYTK